MDSIFDRNVAYNNSDCNSKDSYLIKTSTCARVPAYETLNHFIYVYVCES